MRYLINKCDIDVAAFVETQVDWREVTQEHSLFENLFAKPGQDRRCVTANNVASEKLLTKRSQRGGTVMMVQGRMCTNINKVDRDEMKL